MSSAVPSNSTFSATRSDDAIIQFSHASGAQYDPSDDDSDIIFINSSDFSLTSVEPNEGPSLTRAEMSTQICALKEEISRAEEKRDTEVEALRTEVARLKNVISKVAIATEETMTCDIMYTSSHKVFVLSCGHSFSETALQTHFETQVHAAIRSRARGLPLDTPPPYDAVKLQFLRYIRLEWTPTCPMCRARALAPPREVKRLTTLAKTVRMIAEGEGLGREVDEVLRESNGVPMNEFFTLRQVSRWN